MRGDVGTSMRIFAGAWLSSPRRGLEETDQRRPREDDRLPPREGGAAICARRAASAAVAAACARADRLVKAPVFVMCTLRSGSTLLRVLLNSHSKIHAPHEIHLRYISVNLDRKWSERSMKEMGLDADTLALPALGPDPPPRAVEQRQADHRRQDAEQRLHRRRAARVLAGRALHLPAAPSGGDRASRAGTGSRGGPTPTTRRRTSTSSAATARRSRPRARTTTASRSATRS